MRCAIKPLLSGFYCVGKDVAKTTKPPEVKTRIPEVAGSGGPEVKQQFGVERSKSGKTFKFRKTGHPKIEVTPPKII